MMSNNNKKSLWVEKVTNRTVVWKRGESDDHVTYVITGERVNHMENIVKPECRHAVLMRGERHIYPTINDDGLKAIADLWDAKVTLTDGLTVYNLPASSTPHLLSGSEVNDEYPYFD